MFNVIDGQKRQFTQPTIVWIATSIAQNDQHNLMAILSFVGDVVVNHDLNKLSFMPIT